MSMLIEVEQPPATATVSLSRLRPFLYGLAGAVLGALLIGLAYTAYLDHERTTSMWNYINQVIAAQKAAQPSAGGIK